MKTLATAVAGALSLIVGWVYGASGLSGKPPPLLGHLHSGGRPYAWTLGAVSALVVVGVAAAGARPSWYSTAKKYLRVGAGFVSLAVAVAALTWAAGSTSNGVHDAGQLTALVVGVGAVGVCAGLTDSYTKVGVGALALLAAAGVIALLVSTARHTTSSGVLVTRWWAAAVAAAIVVFAIALVQAVMTVGRSTPKPAKAKAAESVLVDGKLKSVTPDEQAAAYRRRGLRAVYVGVDGRVSTSKLQVVLWTLLVLFMLVDVWLQNRCFGGTCVKIANVHGQNVIDLGHLTLQPEYWILLGFPAGAAAYAMALMKGSSVDKAAITAAEQDGGIVRGFRETVSDDTGTPDLGDAQYFLFNLTGLSYVLITFLQQPYRGLPDVPATLVGLMGVSAATYATKKAVIAVDKPTVRSLTPSNLLIGVDQFLAIDGTDFLLPGVGQPTALNDVVIGGRSLRVVEARSRTILSGITPITWSQDQVVVDLSLFDSTAAATDAITRTGLTLSGGRCETTVVVRDNRGIGSDPEPITIRPRS